MGEQTPDQKKQPSPAKLPLKDSPKPTSWGSLLKKTLLNVQTRLTTMIDTNASDFDNTTRQRFNTVDELLKTYPYEERQQLATAFNSTVQLISDFFAKPDNINNKVTSSMNERLRQQTWPRMLPEFNFENGQVVTEQTNLTGWQAQINLRSKPSSVPIPKDESNKEMQVRFSLDDLDDDAIRELIRKKEGLENALALARESIPPNPERANNIADELSKFNSIAKTELVIEIGSFYHPTGGSYDFSSLFTIKIKRMFDERGDKDRILVVITNPKQKNYITIDINEFLQSNNLTPISNHASLEEKLTAIYNFIAEKTSTSKTSTRSNVEYRRLKDEDPIVYALYSTDEELPPNS